MVLIRSSMLVALGRASALVAVVLVLSAVGSGCGQRKAAESSGASLRWMEEERVTEGFTAAMVSPNNARSVAVDADGTVHVVFTGDIGPVYNIYCRDRVGGSWGEMERITDTEAPIVSDMPALAVGPRGEVYVAWSEGFSHGYTIMFSERSEGVWSEPAAVARDSCIAKAPSLACSRDGVLQLVWEEKEGVSSRVVYAFRKGGRWSVPRPISGGNGNDAREPCVAVSAQGSPHVVWTAASGGEEWVEHAVRTAAGWSEPERVSGSSASAKRPCVGVGESGVVHVVWEDHRRGNAAVYYREKRGGKWRQEVMLSDPRAAAFRPAVASGGEGVVHVVWYDARWGKTEAVYRGRIGENWGPAERLSNSPEPTYFVSVAAGAAGTAHVVYQDKRDGRFDVYYRAKGAAGRGTSRGTGGTTGGGSGS